MTDLTFQQRRAAFEDMLGRAVRVMDNTGRLQETPPEDPERSLARLANEVAGLCHDWVADVPRAAAGESSLDLSSAVTSRALTVAAHCLQAITDLEVSKGVAMRDILTAIVSGVDEPFSRPNALDLGIDPRLRVQSLLTNLGGVVAAHCLQIITDLEVSKGVAMRDILTAIVSGVDEPFSRPNALDLGIDPRLRVQSLLTNLDGMAKSWPAPLTINAGTKAAAETRQALTLAALACDAVCTAVAAERGLWQAES